MGVARMGMTLCHPYQMYEMFFVVNGTMVIVWLGFIVAYVHVIACALRLDVGA